MPHGTTLGRFLRANGVEATVMEYNPDQVDLLRKMGFNVYYFDATQLDLLRAAGAEDAKILISTIKFTETNKKLVELCQENFPHFELMIRGKRVNDYTCLYHCYLSQARALQLSPFREIERIFINGETPDPDN